jgi:hypothetical protein
MSQPSAARRAVPVLLSLAIHALLLVLAWRAAGWRDPPLPPAEGTPFAEGTLALCFSPLAPPRPPAGPDEGALDVAIEPPRLVEPPLSAGGVAQRARPAASPAARPAPGAGSAGGVARPTLFALPATAHSVVYVLDHSVSMGPSGALEAARREVLASLRQLPAGVRFGVIPYNRYAEPLPLGPGALVPADAVTIARAAQLLADLRAEGGTDHARALRSGLALRPDVLFFVTDADDLNPAEVQAVTRCNAGRTAIHVVELGGGAARPEAPLGRLAAGNGGTYRRVRPGG